MGNSVGRQEKERVREKRRKVYQLSEIMGISVEWWEVRQVVRYIGM
ncbi:hypothetical protein [Anaerocolumna sp.]|nr:hypothetical protein [Anaerocolumna sp.]